MDRQHNQYGEAILGVNAAREGAEQARLRFDPVILAGPQRGFAEAIVPAICDRSGWTHHAAAAQPDHVHTLISAAVEGQTVRRLLKRLLSQELSARWPLPSGASWWAEGGSVKWVWDEPYFNNGQRTPVVNAACWRVPTPALPRHYNRTVSTPILLSTWSFGQPANRAAWPRLVDADGSSLDAVEAVCRHCEADPANHTVGLGGWPDASGEVSLDASVMLSPAWCGSVSYVRHYIHAVSIARLVMEKTPHVMLTADGAERLAAEHGFAPVPTLLTDETRDAWQKWKAGHGFQCFANIEEFAIPLPAEGDDADTRPAIDPDRHHDTIGSLALDCTGTLASACSTSGLAWKLPGRVGDSPIIGQGLYVDPKAGAAVATGTGELMMGCCATFLAVEKMRSGDDPQRAAEAVVRRIADSYQIRRDHQVGLITLAPDGRWGSAALRPGFRVAVKSPDRDELTDPGHILLPAM